MKKTISVLVVSILAFSGVSAEVGGSTTKNMDDGMFFCTTQWAPVCGIDGKTYSNSCFAGDMEIAYGGVCTNYVDQTLLDQLYNNTQYVKKIRNILSNISTNKLSIAIWKADEIIQRIEASKDSKELKTSKITKVTFIRDLIESEFNGR